MLEPSDVVTIIARLRDQAAFNRINDTGGTLCDDAANLIEALCAELAHHAGWRA